MNEKTISIFNSKCDVKRNSKNLVQKSQLISLIETSKKEEQAPLVDENKINDKKNKLNKKRKMLEEKLEENNKAMRQIKNKKNFLML